MLMSGPYPSSRSATLTRALALAAILLAVLLLAGSAPVGEARPRAALEATEEWQSLRALWQTLLDHSAGQVRSRKSFEELAPQVNASVDGIAQLAKANQLPEKTASVLANLVRARYAHIAASCYPTGNAFIADQIELASYQAYAQIELYLAWLRNPPGESKDRSNAVASAKSRIARQLEFLRRLDHLEAERQRVRAGLRERETQGEKADWAKFHTESAQHTQQLLDSFGPGQKVKISRDVSELMQYVLRLTLPSSPAPGPPQS